MKAVSNLSAAEVEDLNDDHWKIKGRKLEEAGNNTAAAKLYESVLKQFPHEAYIYDRLLIIYRKGKEYKKELATAKRAIASFSELFELKLPKKKSTRVASLSKSILVSVGLATRKGTPLYLPQPIARWDKRLKTIHARLRKS